MSIKLFRRGATVKQPTEPAFYKIDRGTKMAKVSPEAEPVGTARNETKDFGKIVVYTCITGGYDELKRPAKTDGVDYVCFTDNTGMPANGWELRPMPDGLDGLSAVKQQRMVKVLPHKYLGEYDTSIWVDGSVEVKSDVLEFMRSVCDDSFSVFIPKHPTRSCIYEECKAVKSIGKDRTDLPDRQIKKYSGEGFPEKYGLVQSNIMLRRHKDPECVKLMEAWAEEIRKFSHRDQLSFNYALWKTGVKCFKYLDKKTCNSKYFYWNPKHGKTLKNGKKK